METEALIKKQQEQIEELQKQIASGIVDPEKINNTMAGMKDLLTPQMEQMKKVAEQLQDAGKKIQPFTDFLNSEIGKEAMKKYFGK